MLEMKHVALSMDTRDHAIEFYQNVLGAELKKEFRVPKELVFQIFSINIDTGLDVLVFEINGSQFEIFLYDKLKRDCLDHVCIAVEDRFGFIRKCKENGLPVSIIAKDKKEIVFIKDFVGNLFEVKKY